MATGRPGAVSAAMEPPPPASRCSEAAAAALGHLRGVEKQLQNEGLVFDLGTVQHLEDAIKAIKKLEKERKHILELLEEETIKNCNLRVRVKGIPEMVMKEFEELVTAARRSQFNKITEIEASMEEIVSAIERTFAKQRLFEEHNVTLCEEQKRFGDKHEDAVELLNKQMATKHSFCVQINEFQNLQKDEEEEYAWQLGIIRELEAKRAWEMAEFQAQQRVLEKEITKLQADLRAQRFKVSQKRREYEALLARLRALLQQINQKEKAIAAGKEELAKIFKEIKRLIAEYDGKKAEKQKILQMKAELKLKMERQDSGFHEQIEALHQQLEEADQQMESMTRVNNKLRKENNFLRAQYEALQEQERVIVSQRDHLAKEFERLSNEVTEKLDRLTKRLVEIQNLEEEKEKLQDMLEMSESSYSRELGSLEFILQKETDRSKTLKQQLEEIIAQAKKLKNSHAEFMSRTHKKMDADERTLFNLLKQNGLLQKEVEESEMYTMMLRDKLSKKTALFKKFTDSTTAELQKLEDEYHNLSKLFQEAEEKLSADLLISEQLQMKLQEKRITYDDQKDIYTELHEEELTLAKSITLSLKEIALLRRLKIHLRGEISTLRETAKRQHLTFSESLKFLSRDIYEANRKLYIVNAENVRFREGIAHLRADISTLESEEEACRSQRQQTQEAMRALHNHFDKKWSEDKYLWQLFLRGERKVLKALEVQIERFKKRNWTVNYVSNGLQLNYEGVVSLIKNKPIIEGNSPAASSTTTVADAIGTLQESGGMDSSATAS